MYVRGINRKKYLKILINTLIFALVAGFGYYMVRSMVVGEIKAPSEDRGKIVRGNEDGFVSPYRKKGDFSVAFNIHSMDIFRNIIYIAQSHQVSLFNLSGGHIRDFRVEEGVRDIAVEDEVIFLLYPSRIDLYSSEGEKKDEWGGYSSRTDYCSITTTDDYLFVSDAGNKLIFQYDKHGRLVRHINSPQGFIIPSYSFDIISIHDTLYCANSGRHTIESYTMDGAFIQAFGTSGAQAGAFAGCCNPAYLTKNRHGHILTSEKGAPRISCYGRDGRFRTILFDANMLGGGTAAYRVAVSGEELYIAGKKSVSTYCFDPNLGEKSCVGCSGGCHF